LNRISRGEDEITLEPKVMEVLVFLADRAGKTVTKEDFFETVWDGAVLTDDALSRCISGLRKSLDDDTRNPRYIETIRKLGYRLIAPVRMVEDDEVLASQWSTDSAALEEPSPEASPGRTRRLVAPVLAVLGVLVIGLSVYMMLDRKSEIPTPPTVVPYTNFSGIEIHPSFSPDGEAVAFSAKMEGESGYDIYLKRERSQDPVRLTQDPADEYHPTFSPDGRSVAFVRSTEDSSAVLVVPLLGGSEQLLVNFGKSEVGSLDWSPDGQRLAISAKTTPFESFRIVVVGSDSATVHQLTEPPRYEFGDVFPAYSPDGRYLAFARGVTENLQDVFVYDFRDESIRQVTNDSTGIEGLDWMPDSRSIVFASQRQDPSGLWMIDLDGGEPTILGPPLPRTRYESPTVSPDGRKIVYSDHGLNVNVWRVFKPRGSQSLRSRPAVTSTYVDSNPDLSPDGRQIAFSSNRSGNREIWVADADGSNQTELTSLLGSATVPRWSPDGTQILFEWRNEGQSDIYVVDSSGAAATRITESPQEDTNPRWSYDGESIYFSSNRSGDWEMWRVGRDGSDARQLTWTGGRFGMGSADGQSLYFVRRDTVGIWKRSLDGSGGPGLVFDQLDPRDWANWATRPSGVYFVQRLPYAAALSFYFFESKRTIRLLTLGNIPHVPAFTAASDFSSFAYTQIDDSGGDLMLMEGF
jgi:Tol biopolymer transport system component/DNA-binding winged helix-turn-helix (wHTH) protein